MSEGTWDLDLDGWTRYAIGVDFDHSPRLSTGIAYRYFDVPEDYADANIFVLARRNDLLIREVPVNMRPRSGGASMHDRGALRYLGGMTARTLREGLR